nr:MAG TPA: hypothetical protein [Bacteriophage sp.]
MILARECAIIQVQLNEVASGEKSPDCVSL